MEPASPVFHGRLQGAVTSLHLWPAGPASPPRTPSRQPEEPGSRDWAGGHSRLCILPAPHTASASTASNAPGPA
jgi:hypothetical protein